jgi:hypothetical protein
MEEQGGAWTSVEEHAWRIMGYGGAIEEDGEVEDNAHYERGGA